MSRPSHWDQPTLVYRAAWYFGRAFTAEASKVLGAPHRDKHGAGSGAISGNVGDARKLLEVIDGWLTEGFNTRDLKEATALLPAAAAPRSARG